MFNAAMIGSMRRGAYIVNNARGKIMDRDAVVDGERNGGVGVQHRQVTWAINRNFIVRTSSDDEFRGVVAAPVCHTRYFSIFGMTHAALKSGHLGGYAGDVWFPQPPPKDHPWRTAPHTAMTPHISGTSISAQARYAAGVRE